MTACARHWTGTVPPHLAGHRLDRILAELVPGLSRSQAQRLLAHGQCLLEGAPARASSRPRAGERVWLELSPPPNRVAPEHAPLDVLLEDDHLIVVNKPAGIVVHPARGAKEGTLLNMLVGHVGPAVRPSLVHRLDRYTSGAILAAKTVSAHRRLKCQAEAGGLRRVYWALVWGVPRPAVGVLQGTIAPERGHKDRMTLSASGKPAEMSYRVLGAGQAPEGPVALVRAELQTGRTHQVRVQLQGIGHPLVGDRIYRCQALTSTDARLAGQALHARELWFEHPTTAEPTHIIAPLPETLQALLADFELLPGNL